MINYQALEAAPSQAKAQWDEADPFAWCSFDGLPEQVWDSLTSEEAAIAAAPRFQRGHVVQVFRQMQAARAL